MRETQDEGNARRRKLWLLFKDNQEIPADEINGPLLEVTDPSGAIDNLINNAAYGVDVRFEQFNIGYAEGMRDGVNDIGGASDITRLIDVLVPTA